MVNLRLVEHVEEVTGWPEGRLALRPDEVAHALGISVAKVRALLSSGDMPGRKLDNSWLVPVKGLELWLNGDNKSA